MEALTPATPVHFYDTRAHVILCGLRGFEHRSTKHSRSVTCHACVGLLRERLAAPDDAGAAAPA
jgi:hypothetical protein